LYPKLEDPPERQREDPRTVVVGKPTAPLIPKHDAGPSAFNKIVGIVDVDVLRLLDRVGTIRVEVRC
jgi:hypothetical protein